MICLVSFSLENTAARTTVNARDILVSGDTREASPSDRALNASSDEVAVGNPAAAKTNQLLRSTRPMAGSPYHSTVPHDAATIITTSTAKARLGETFLRPAFDSKTIRAAQIAASKAKTIHIRESCKRASSMIAHTQCWGHG